MQEYARIQLMVTTTWKPSKRTEALSPEVRAANNRLAARVTPGSAGVKPFNQLPPVIQGLLTAMRNPEQASKLLN